MNAIHKILVPTDFSAHADEAFRVAHTPAVVSEAGGPRVRDTAGDNV